MHSSRRGHPGGAGRTKSKSSFPEPCTVDVYCTVVYRAPSTTACAGRDCAWQVGEWGECSDPCGGVAERAVTCASGDDADCTGVRPNATMICVEANCHWTCTAWTECNETIGMYKTRFCDCPGDPHCLPMPPVQLSSPRRVTRESLLRMMLVAFPL